MSMFARLRLAFGTKLFQKRDLRLTVPAGSCLVPIKNIRGRMNDNRREHYESILDAVAKQASETERRAEEAERETVKLKKCEYMSNHIGECFEGVISGVTEWGFFVELQNTVEGLVRVTDLTDDFYEFYEDTYELAGTATNKRYKLGQKIKVVVDSTDKIMRTIDFKPAE